MQPRTVQPRTVQRGRRAVRTARPKLFRHPGRVAVVLVAVLAAANLGVILLMSADTSAPSQLGLPDTVESIAPARNSITSRRDTISVDLRDDLFGVILLDRVEIPEDQLSRVEELGLVSFRPGPDTDLTALSGGEHTVVVQYWPRADPRPARPASFAWTFRVAA